MSAARNENGADLMPLDFNHMITRLIQADPKKLSQALATDVIKAQEKAKANIEQAKREIADGARPRKGRFRL